jgi:hypothetical protein
MTRRTRERRQRLRMYDPAQSRQFLLFPTKKSFPAVSNKYKNQSTVSRNGHGLTISTKVSLGEASLGDLGNYLAYLGFETQNLADLGFEIQNKYGNQYTLSRDRLPLEYVIPFLREAILRGVKANHMKPVSLEDEHHLTIFTEVSWGTLGDYFAALRLIRLLQEVNKKLTVHWVIKGRNEEIPDDLVSSDTIKIQKIEHWDEIFTTPSIVKEIKETQAIFVFPTFHFLKEEHINRIRKDFDKLMISCLEYSYGIRGESSDMIELYSGLGDDEMGVFTLPHQGGHPLSQVDPNQDILRALFSQQETTDLVHVDEARAEQYDKEHVLFFGYANKDVERVENGEKKPGRVVNKGVSVENFVRLCHEIAKNDPNKRHVDIVTPITMEDFKALGVNYADYSAVRFIGKENGKTTATVIHEDNSASTKPELRIINLFRFDGATFQKLMAASHPFKLCTGDQSLSDVISTENAIVFYQAMEWKAKLAENYIKIAQKALDAAKLDPNTSIAIQYLRAVNSKAPLDLDEIKTMLLDPKLLEQFNIIHRYIIKYKNLNDTLPKNLVSFLRYLKNDEPAISDSILYLYLMTIRKALMNEKEAFLKSKSMDLVTQQIGRIQRQSVAQNEPRAFFSTHRSQREKMELREALRVLENFARKMNVEMDSPEKQGIGQRRT